MQRQAPALVVSKEEDVVSHGYVMYGLVKPGKDGKCIESAAAMVNVIPRKRIYRMGTTNELDTFRSEILKRPLVIQPVVEAGSGIQKLNCFFRVQKEHWVMMLNTNHPKIMGRIMTGIDAAKTLMKRGEPFILEFMLSNVVRRLYYLALANKAPSRYQYMDCHHGDLIIRGSGDSFHKGMKWEVKAQHLQFDFDDITVSDIMVRTLKEAAYERQSPLIQVIPDRELRQILPGWTFEQAEEEEEEEEEEEYAFELEGSQGASASNHQQAAPQRGRIKGRSSRGAGASSNYEVSVELHAPIDEQEEPQQWNSNAATHQRYQTDGNERTDHGYEATRGGGQYTSLTNERTDHVYEDTRLPPNGANHYYQGSGRSGSSATDSGYEGENDAGGFEDRKYGRLLQAKGPTENRHGRDYPANGQIRGYADNRQRQGYPDNVQGSGYTANEQGRGYPDNRQGRGYPDNRQGGSKPDQANVLPTDRYNYDNPAFMANDNYNIVEQSVERNKALASRLLANHTRGPADNRHREGYLPPTNMTTISQNIDTHDGRMGESAI